MNYSFFEFFQMLAESMYKVFLSLIVFDIVFLIILLVGIMVFDYFDKNNEGNVSAEGDYYGRAEETRRDE